MSADKITNIARILLSLHKEQQKLCDTFREMLNSDIDQETIKDIYNMISNFGINQITLFSKGILPEELIKNGIEVNYELVKANHKELMERLGDKNG